MNKAQSFTVAHTMSVNQGQDLNVVGITAEASTRALALTLIRTPL